MFFKKMFKSVPIDIPSEKPNDPGEYFSWNDLLDLRNKKKCGELCVAYIVKNFGEDLQEDWGLEDLLNDWRNAFESSKNLRNIYKSVMGVVKDEQGKMLKPKMLVEEQIKNILILYNITEISNYQDKLIDRMLGFVISPGRIKELLDTQVLIAQVWRDDSGNLVRKDKEVSKHWVVLTGMNPYGINRGRVEIYNPWINDLQEFSYSEFKNSLTPTFTRDCGFWVTRKGKSETKGTEDQITFG